jgi:hypothetical protein
LGRVFSVSSAGADRFWMPSGYTSEKRRYLTGVDILAGQNDCRLVRKAF